MHPSTTNSNSTIPACEKKHLHFIGICGKAMGGIAAALAGEGWRVTGSDEKCYEPMMQYLTARGISISTPYAAENVPPDAQLVVVGKRVAATNPELVQVLKLGLEHCSFPQLLQRHFLLHSRNAVVAGGVGKTTTTSMLAWILEHAGMQPDYLIGGLARNFSSPTRLSGGAFTVLEGDEYASCFDDPQPKFLHYHPEVAIITNIVEDHPDIYSSLAELRGVFSDLVALLPPHGCLILPDDDADTRQLTSLAGCKVCTVGLSESATARITGLDLQQNGSSFQLMGAAFAIPSCGLMNVSNAAMAAVAAAHFGVAPEQSSRALALFQGVHNRQEEKTMGDCTLVCDKASHPRALMELVRALRQRFPDRRLVSVIQPRATGGKDWVYQRELPEALAQFDRVILTSAYEHNPQQPQRWADDPFCLDMLVENLESHGSKVTISRTIAEIYPALLSQIADGDVVVLTVLEQSEALQKAVEFALANRTSQCASHA